jgi:hypothetical protein
MKLYKFAVSDLIVECEVEKETPTKYKYKFPNSNTLTSIKKTKVDVPLVYTSYATIYHLVATSKSKLIQIAAQTIDNKIEDSTAIINALEFRKQNILSKHK